MEKNTAQESQQQKRPRKHDLSDAEKVKALLDEIETMVNGATQIPLSGRCMVKSGDLLDCVSKVRTLFVHAFAQAESIVADEQSILGGAREKANQMADQAEAQVNQANAEAERIIKEAQESASATAQQAEADYNAKVNQILSREEIVREAHLKAQEIIANAQEEEKRCHARGGEIIDDANRDAQKIIEDAQRSADAEREQARKDMAKMMDNAGAALKEYGNGFGNQAMAIDDAVRQMKACYDAAANQADELLMALKTCSNAFSTTAADLEKSRDTVLHPEYFEQ